ncbi:hypothetical protein [uncultured Psychroserpens sp.]|uniref:hypothetical protein n=1 Tax=uncultured Psychroserpens sp. TaxID=255436 RepID=UPI00260A872E|nr:hypothetical protein [uncultured Psychroserpens sp.]
MSGVNLTIISCNKKISKSSNFFSDLGFDKEKKQDGEFFCEFTVNKILSTKEKDIFIHDDFYVYYNENLKNHGYSEQLWKKIIKKLNNPLCSLNMICMSRNYGSYYVLSKHLKELILEGYHFYIVSNNVDNKIKKKFNSPTDLLEIENNTYLLSNKVINYLIQNEVLDFFEY